MTDQVRRIGFIRTSPLNPHPNAQAEAVQQAGCTELFDANAAADQRQALQEVLDLLGDGDALIVYRMDRLARDEHDAVNLQQQLKAAGVELVVTSEQNANGDTDAE